MPTAKKAWGRFAATLQAPLRLPQFRAVSNTTSVIVETRALPHLEYVLRKHCSHLNDSWALRVICGKENVGYVNDIVAKMSCNIGVQVLHSGIKSVKDYNGLMLSREFWTGLETEKALIFQEDGFLLKDGVDDFLDYDYIGAPWYEQMDLSPSEVGNGGFSLRSVDKLVRALDEITQEEAGKIGRPLDFHYLDNQISEDVYFSRALSCYHDVKIPSVAVASTFSTEWIPSEDPLGWHLWSCNYLDLNFHIGEKT
jgi:hypothetical protein